MSERFLLYQMAFKCVPGMVAMYEIFFVRCTTNSQVLGAALWEVRVGGESVIYSGDYNMTPDRHLGAAFVDTVRPNLLITEST